MATVIVILGSAWLGALLKLQSLGLTLGDVSRVWFLLLVFPAIALPLFSTASTVSRALVAPSAGAVDLWVIGAFSGLALSLSLFGFLSRPMAFLVAIPFVQLLLLRWTHKQFTRRFGRPPAAAPNPPMGMPNFAPYSLGAWRYSREDLRYAALTTLIAFCPLFLLVVFIRDGA